MVFLYTFTSTLSAFIPSIVYRIVSIYTYIHSTHNTFYKMSNTLNISDVKNFRVSHQIWQKKPFSNIGPENWFQREARKIGPKDRS